MIFYSDKFYYNEIYSQDYNICLVSEETGVLNEYGISFNNESENEITLSFCYVDHVDQPMVWESEVLENVLEWLITDEYREFISEDDDTVIYFFRGIKYTKRFTSEMKGLLDVTFKVLSPHGYRKSIQTFSSSVGVFNIVNPSNLSKPYKPVIEIRNILDSNISISNTTTNKTALTISNTLNKNIVIDNKMGTITDSEGNNLILNSNRKWIELEKGSNLIAVDGDCDITFKSYFPVMV